MSDKETYERGLNANTAERQPLKESFGYFRKRRTRGPSCNEEKCTESLIGVCHTVVRKRIITSLPRILKQTVDIKVKTTGKEL